MMGLKFSNSNHFGQAFKLGTIFPALYPIVDQPYKNNPILSICSFDRQACPAHVCFYQKPTVASPTKLTDSRIDSIDRKLKVTLSSSAGNTYQTQMASSNLKTMKSPLTTSVDKGHLLPMKASVMIATKINTATVPLQVKCEKGHEPSTTDGFAVSRRHMMKCLTAEVLGLTLLPKPAEARMSRLEMKKKMMKKLEELREKAGVSKPKTENNGMKKSPILPLPLPTPEGRVGALVEANINNAL